MPDCGLSGCAPVTKDILFTWSGCRLQNESVCRFVNKTPSVVGKIREESYRCWNTMNTWGGLHGQQYTRSWTNFAQGPSNWHMRWWLSISNSSVSSSPEGKIVVKFECKDTYIKYTHLHNLEILAKGVLFSLVKLFVIMNGYRKHCSITVWVEVGSFTLLLRFSCGFFALTR